MPLILGAQSAAVDTGYQIENSCRFNDDAYLSRTPSSSGDPKTFTISCWIKRGKLGVDTADQTICTTEKGSGYKYTYPYYLNGADDKLYAFGGTYAGGSPVTLEKKTAAVFRDPGAWFHYYCAFDTTESVAADRVKLYINGTQITDAGAGGGYSPNTIPGLNVDTFFGNTTDPFTVSGGSAGGSPFDGYMAEFIFVDGTVPAVTEFGEFDEDSPTIWRPKDPSEATITWGTNGLWLDFKDSADFGNDVSGQGNDMTANTLAAADQATDTPTNNFATLNPLLRSLTNPTALSEGNCKSVLVGSSNADWGGGSTIGVSAGKWYWEVKVPTLGSSLIGITDNPAEVIRSATEELTWDVAIGYGYKASDGYKRINETGTQVDSAYGDTYDNTDIIGVALNMDDLELKFYKDNVVQNSGTAIDIIASTNSGFYFPAATKVGTATSTFEFNFGGCSAFAITSEASDENGYGKFEYAPPSGFLAICTKNLGSDGG